MERAFSWTKSGQLRGSDKRSLDQSRRPDQFGYVIAASAKIRNPGVARTIDRYALGRLKLDPVRLLKLGLLRKSFS
jgi:hypothetical protein